MNERPNEHAATASFEFDALRAAENYRRALIREFSPHLGRRVIEVGSGIGQITLLLRQQRPPIEDLLCVEPDAGFCQEFRAAFPDQPLVEGVIDGVSEQQPWHTIISVNVLEHILEDEAELANYHRRLRVAQGRLCLFVPARQEIYAPIDADFGHHRRYSRPDLRAKLERAGFGVIRLDYFNCVGYFAWWLCFRMLKRRKFDLASVRLFDRVIFPWVYELESRVCAPPFGQSLIAIAEAR